MRALCLLILMTLSGCGYSSDDYWDMLKTGVARSLCSAANKSSPAADCNAKEGVRTY